MDEGDRAVPAEQSGVPDAAPSEQGTLLLSRVQDSYRDLLRRYTVVIDGKPVGRIGRGRTLRFPLPPGEHQLQLTIDWCSSQPLTAQVEEGETVCFACSPGGAASEGLGAVSTNRADYITLRQTPGPIVTAKVPLNRSTRLLVGAAVGFFAGGTTLIGALVWRFTGLAPKADDAAAAVGLAVTLASVGVFRVGRRKATRHHQA